MEGYPSRIAQAVTGVSPTQLSYWARTGVVTPTVSPGRGRGSSRLYSFADLVQLQVVANVLRTGISLQRVRKAVGYLRKNFPDLSHPLAELALLTDGVSIFHLTADPKVIVDTVRHSGQMVFAVALRELVNDLRRRVETIPMPQTHTIAVGEFEFPVTLTPDEDDGGYVVECPALPGCVSQGDTVTEALENIADAATGWLEVNAEMESRGQIRKLPVKRFRKRGKRRATA
ncbi:MAG: MerR family transcriptional regulator [Phycisphaerales bacterium]|nr:MerR family transcriptional regulator [Phycisphaerales bacterium]